MYPARVAQSARNSEVLSVSDRYNKGHSLREEWPFVLLFSELFLAIFQLDHHIARVGEYTRQMT